MGELIETEDSLLLCSQRHARLLRSQRQQDKILKLQNSHERKVSLSFWLSLLIHSQTLQQRELTINTYQNNLIETEDSRLVVLETSARELRRRRSELLKANEREEQLKQKIDDSNYEIDGLREQIVSLEREKDEVIKTESELRQELKEKDSLNKGLMDRLVEEANAHKETILQHEVSLSPPCSC
jgi:chromosome segregation ATPase